jgi:hypothetical protein
MNPIPLAQAEIDRLRPLLADSEWKDEYNGSTTTVKWKWRKPMYKPTARHSVLYPDCEDPVHAERILGEDHLEGLPTAVLAGIWTDRQSIPDWVNCNRGLLESLDRVWKKRSTNTTGYVRTLLHGSDME